MFLFSIAPLSIVALPPVPPDPPSAIAIAPAPGIVLQANTG